MKGYFIMENFETQDDIIEIEENNDNPLSPKN